MFLDVVGYSLYDMKLGEFNIKKGFVFINILFVDEINCVLVKM